jgi:NitT/TauT family transport system substrate-binding protein
MKRWITGLLAAGLVLLSTTALHARETVNISLFTWPGYGFWFIARDQDLAPDLNLEIQVIEDPYESFALMSAGRLDVSSSTVEYGPIAAHEDTPIRLVAYTNPSYGVDKIIVRPGVESAQDLVGEQVAVLEGGLTQIFMGIWLEDNGVGIDQVQFVNLIMDDAVGAMLSGQVAAAEFWEPFGSVLLENMPGAKVVATSSEPYWIETALLGDGMYMSEAFLDAKPEVASRVMQAYFDAVAFWKANPEEGNRIIARNLGLEIGDVEMVIGTTGNTHEGGVHVFDLAESARFMGLLEGEPPLGLSNGQIRDHWQLTSEWWERFGLIEGIQEPEAGIRFDAMERLVDRAAP